MTAYDQLSSKIYEMDWNELSSLIKDATERQENMEDQVIGAMLNAQDIMKEKKTRRFPDSEREAFYRLLGFDGSYKDSWDVLNKLVGLHSIKYAVAAFVEGNCYPITSEGKSLLRKVYLCKNNEEPVSASWESARERFWEGFLGS